MAKSKPKNLKFLYETVARIVSGALKQEGTLRGLVFEHAKKFIRTHLVLAIEVTRHRGLLEKLISETKLVENEQLDPVLAQVLVFELVLGKQEEFPSGNEIFDCVSKYKKQLEKVLHKLQKSGEFDKLVISKPEAILPRYGRVNTLLASLESVVLSLQNCGFELVDTEGKNYQEFLDCVRSLQPNEFALDFHFPGDLLVFNPSQYLGKLFVCRAGHLILHDKTSYFPVACLGAPPGSTVLDACAAPGMKTAHIAARMKNEGTIYAFDRDMDRLNNLRVMMKSSGVTCCQSKCSDFTQVIPQKFSYSSVEYLLLDPPCSGSGMVNRLDSLTDTTESKSSNRSVALSGLQFKLLCHAAKFPSVKRIVYSTCAVDVQENEQVIKDFIDKNPNTYRVVNALPEWSTRGDSNFDFGKLCVRSSPDKDLTNGFFVAVLDRISEDSVHVAKNSAETTVEKINKVDFESKPNQKHSKQKRIFVRKRAKRGKRERELQRSGLADVKNTPRVSISTTEKPYRGNQNGKGTELSKKFKKKKHDSEKSDVENFKQVEDASGQSYKHNNHSNSSLQELVKRKTETNSNEDCIDQGMVESTKKNKKKRKKLVKENMSTSESGDLKQDHDVKMDIILPDTSEQTHQDMQVVKKHKKHKRSKSVEEIPEPNTESNRFEECIALGGKEPEKKHKKKRGKHKNETSSNAELLIQDADTKEDTECATKHKKRKRSVSVEDAVQPLTSKNEVKKRKHEKRINVTLEGNNSYHEDNNLLNNDGSSPIKKKKKHKKRHEELST